MASYRTKHRADGTAVTHIQIRKRGFPPLTATFARKGDPRACVALTCERSGQGRKSAFADLNVRDGCPVSAVLRAVASHSVVLRVKTTNPRSLGERGPFVDLWTTRDELALVLSA